MVFVNVLTKRNGIALVAVLAVLLVLTLLLPLMFTMSEGAMETALKGSDEQAASYLARSMIEMSVASFQGFYDDAEEDAAKTGSPISLVDNVEVIDTTRVSGRMEHFLRKAKKLKFADMYMYKNTAASSFESVDTSNIKRSDFDSDAEYRRAIENAYATYASDGIVYSTVLPSGYTKDQVKAGQVPIDSAAQVTDSSGQSVTGAYLGYAECSAKFDDSIKYYRTKIDESGESITEIVVEEAGVSPERQYEQYQAKAKAAIAANNELSETEWRYFKVTNKNIEFTSRAVINGRVGTRRCILVLPTKPSDENWIIPANIESNQIFPDTSLASSVSALKMNNSSYFIDGEATNGQPVYSFSCMGNMVISTKNIKYKATEADPFGILNKGQTMDYNTYVEKYNNTVKETNKANAAYNEAHKEDDGFVAKPIYDEIVNRSSDFSLGLHPETTTIKPEKDPAFNCLKTNNMRSWATSAQKDNFVAFTATNAIQIDMPVNLIMNPCRTGRIGDGISKNKSLYKILYLQAPTIVFNDTVNSFISLYTKTSLTALVFDYNAYRMSSIMLSAPQSTPYNYYNGMRGKQVKAGKVYFAEDAYIWLVPFAENGSNYRTQTVYYKGKDIILYKFANAGDVFMFNSEVQTMVNGEAVNAGFSMTGYFMDIIYNKDTTDTSTAKWWQLWSGIQSMIFDSAVSGLRDKTYVAEDLKWIGNMNNGAQGSPNVDDFYVVWDS